MPTDAAKSLRNRLKAECDHSNSRHRKRISTLHIKSIIFSLLHPPKKTHKKQNQKNHKLKTNEVCWILQKQKHIHVKLSMISCVWTSASTCCCTFSGIIIWTPIFQGTFLDWFPRWNTNRFLLAQSHSCISFIIYVRVPNPDTTEISIQWPDLSLNNRSSHRSSPFPYSASTGELGSGFSKTQYDPNFICNFCFVFIHVFCKYTVPIHTYIHISVHT